MNIFDTYITDFDGTLCDTLEANVAAYRQAFKDAGLKFDEQAYRQHFGLHFNDMMDTLSPMADAATRGLIAAQKSLHYAEQAGLVSLNHLLVDILRHARSNGAKIGLATTARKKNASAILKHFALEDLFDAAVFGEDVSKGKPDPECYHKVMGMLGAKPHKTFIIEDTPIGVQAAKKSGAHVLKVAI